MHKSLVCKSRNTQRFHIIDIVVLLLNLRIKKISDIRWHHVKKTQNGEASISEGDGCTFMVNLKALLAFNALKEIHNHVRKFQTRDFN